MSSHPLEPFCNELATRRYTVLPADVIVPSADRLKICAAVFQDANLERDQSDTHPNRSRADAVLRFTWQQDDVEISLGPNQSADPKNRQVITYTANQKGAREYKRLRALEVPELTKLLRNILRLIPRESRRPSGLLGVHAFRTHGDVVFVRHRDGSVDAPVDWVISYVASKHGAGAETQLTLDQAGSFLIAKSVLGEGQLAVHHDATFFHYVTPMNTPRSGSVLRDAIIATIRPEFD